MGNGPNIEREVRAEEVVGVWTLCYEGTTKNQLEADGYRPSPDAIHEIELRADGTCRYRSVTEVFMIPRSSTRYVDAEGTWSLRTFVLAVGPFKKVKSTEIILNVKEAGGRGLGITELFGPLQLWEPWGDTDGTVPHYYSRKAPARANVEK